MSSRGEYGGGYGGGYEQRLAAAANHRSMMAPPSPSLDRRPPNTSSTASGSREVQDYAEKKRQQMQRAEEIKRERNSIKKDDPSVGANRLGQRNIPATPGDIFGPRPNAGPTPNARSSAPPMDDGYGPPPSRRMDESTRDRGSMGGDSSRGGMPPRAAPPAASTPSSYGSRREAAFDSRDTRGSAPPRRPIDRYDDGSDDRGEGARMLSGPPPSHSRVNSASSTASGRGGGGGSDDGYDGGGRALSATTRPRPATREMNGPSSAQPSRGGGYGGSSSSGSGDSVLLKRIEALEEEVRLLRHQNQLFVNFMQKTEQQMAQLSSGSRSSSSSSSSSAKKPPMVGSSSRSDSTGSLSSRDEAKLKTAEQRDPARRSAPPAADPRRARVGGVPTRDDTYDDDQDDNGDHPSDEEEERRAQLERAKSAKQREIDRINQRKKAGPPGGPAASSVPMPANGRMAVSSGGAGVKSGPSSHLRAAVDEPLDDEDRPLTGARNSYDEGEMEGDEGEMSFRGGNGVPDDPYAEVGDLKPCPHCGRNFTDINLARHISKKVCQKKRKVFDMKKQRLEGELKAAIVSAGLSKPAAKKASAAADAKSEKKAKWRADRERLQEAIRAGKQIQKAVAEGIDPSTLPIAQSKVEDDRTPCPHCGRKFAATTAERHIPHCANTKNRPGGPGRVPAKGRR